MTKTLFTIGYEGANIANFLATLSVAGVTHLIDIRDVPASRKPGFSKNSLSIALKDHSIGYSHFKALGDPKTGRDAMRRGDYATFLSIYNDHIEQDAGQASLKDVLAIASEKTSVLLCFERDYKLCHRMLVADRLKGLASFEVSHIGVQPMKPLPRVGGSDARHTRTPAAVI